MKKKLKENSLKNLQSFTQNSEKSREAQKKSVEARKKNKQEKIARENSKEWAWEQYGKDFLEDIAKYGTTKDKVEVIKALFPTDKQVNDINFKNLNPDVIVETVEMRKKAEAYTKKLLND
jgi:hypothetical protein